MSHTLTRLSKSILEKPQMMSEDAFRTIAEVLDDRSEYLSLRKEAQAALDLGLPNIVVETDSRVGDNVGVINIEGALTARPSPWAAVCGGTSYEQIIKSTEAYIAEGKDTLLLKVQSGGGEAFKIFSSNARLKKLTSDAGMKVIAYYDDIAASAAYAISCFADEIIAHPESSTIGSIGVIVSLLDDSVAMKEAGLKRVFINAGANKHPYTEVGSFKQSFLDDIQTDVDSLYDRFVTLVATERNLSEAAVRSTEASTFNAEDALKLGLVDKLMDEPEFYEYLSMLSTSDESEDMDDEEDESEDNELPYPKPRLNKYLKGENLMAKASTVAEMTVTPEMLTQLEQFAQMKEQLAEMSVANTSQATALAAFQAKELSAKQEALSAKLDTNAFLAGSKEQLMGFFMSVDVDKNTKSLMDSVIASASTEMAAQATAHAAQLVTSATEASALLEAEKAKTLAVEAEKEHLKVEFAAPNAIRGEEKEENLQAIPHKEKMARAVAAAKAKKASL